MRRLAPCTLAPWLMVLATGNAAAQATALLETRASTLHLAYGGGFATESSNGVDGSAVPVDLAGPATLGARGADAFLGGYLGWTVTWQMAWDMQQSWALGADAHTLLGAGYTLLAQSNAVVGPGCAPACPAAVAMTATNWQDLQFTLDAPSAYQFHSEVAPNQGVQVNRWDEARQRWLPLLASVPGGVADRSGSFAAGRYQVVNSRVIDVLGSNRPELANAWSFSLTLADASWAAAPVPEPGSAWLVVAGLGGLLHVTVGHWTSIAQLQRLGDAPSRGRCPATVTASRRRGARAERALADPEKALVFMTSLSRSRHWCPAWGTGGRPAAD